MLKFSALTLEKSIATGLLVLSSWVIIWLAIPVWQNQNLGDDSFITLTYAKNLAEGRGFVYNHPPATLGTTTPLFTFVTALLAIILPFVSIIEAAILVSVMAWIGLVWMLYFTMRHLTLKPILSVIVAIVASLSIPSWTPLIGMELLLFEFLLVLTIYLNLKKKLFYAGLCAAALFLTRGEGALLGIILFIYLWFNERKIPVQFVLGSLIILTVWFIYAEATFGTPIPNTLAAKRAQAQLPGSGYFIERIVYDLLPGHLRSFELFGFWLLNPYLILISLGLIYIFRWNKTLLIFIVWGLTYILAYSVLNPKPYSWYMLHIIFILQLLAGLGLVWVSMMLGKARYQYSLLIKSLVIIILTFLLLYPSLYFVVFRAQNFFGDHRAPAYKAIASWLNENTDPEDSVAFIEIGYLGYFTNNRIIDLAGLVDPLATQHLVTDGFAWGFWHYKPDYYIYAKEFDWALSEVKVAINEYTLVHQITRDNSPTPIYILKRNDK